MSCEHTRRRRRLGPRRAARGRGSGASRRTSQTCAICRREVAELQMVADTLPLAAAQVAPPPELKDRIMSAVRAEAEVLQAAGPEADVVAREPGRRGGGRRGRARGTGAQAARPAVVAAAVPLAPPGPGRVRRGGHPRARDRLRRARLRRRPVGADRPGAGRRARGPRGAGGADRRGRPRDARRPQLPAAAERARLPGVAQAPRPRRAGADERAVRRARRHRDGRRSRAASRASTRCSSPRSRTAAARPRRARRWSSPRPRDRRVLGGPRGPREGGERRARSVVPLAGRWTPPRPAPPPRPATAIPTA